MSETRLRKYPQSKGKQQIRLKVKNILETAWESGREITKLTPSRVSCVAVFSIGVETWGVKIGSPNLGGKKFGDHFDWFYRV